MFAHDDASWEKSDFFIFLLNVLVGKIVDAILEATWIFTIIIKVCFFSKFSSSNSIFWPISYLSIVVSASFIIFK